MIMFKMGQPPPVKNISSDEGIIRDSTGKIKAYINEKGQQVRVGSPSDTSNYSQINEQNKPKNEMIGVYDSSKQQTRIVNQDVFSVDTLNLQNLQNTPSTPSSNSQSFTQFQQQAISTPNSRSYFKSNSEGLTPIGMVTTPQATAQPVSITTKSFSNQQSIKTQSEVSKMQKIENQTAYFLGNTLKIPAFQPKNPNVSRISDNGIAGGIRKQISEKPVETALIAGTGALFEGGIMGAKYAFSFIPEEVYLKTAIKGAGYGIAGGLIAQQGVETYKEGQKVGYQVAIGEEIVKFGAFNIGSKGFKTGVEKTYDFFKTRGLTEVSAEKVFDIRTLQQGVGTASGKSIKENIRLFETGLKNEGYVQTSSPSSLKGDVVGMGDKGRAGVEDTGLYVSPAKKGATGFLEIEGFTGKSDYSLNILEGKSFGKPTVTRIYDVTGVQKYPFSVKKQAGFGQLTSFQKSNVGKGKAYITKRSELGFGELKRQKFTVLEDVNLKTVSYKKGQTITESGTTEIEAVIGSGETFTGRKTRFYTKVGNRRVIIEEKSLNLNRGKGKVFSFAEVKSSSERGLSDLSSVMTKSKTVYPFSFGYSGKSNKSNLSTTSSLSNSSSKSGTSSLSGSSGFSSISSISGVSGISSKSGKSSKSGLSNIYSRRSFVSEFSKKSDKSSDAFGYKRKKKGNKLSVKREKQAFRVLPDLMSVSYTEYKTGQEAIVPRLTKKVYSLSSASFGGRSTGFVPTEQMRTKRVR